MRFAEVFLRLGCSLVGWMVLIAYALWLAVAARVGCEASGDALFRLLLFAAPIAVPLSFLIMASRPLPEVHGVLRWIAVIPALLSPLIAVALWRFAEAVLVNGSAVCGGGQPPIWQTLWVPVQVTAVLVCAVLLFRIWSPNR